MTPQSQTPQPCTGGPVGDTGAQILPRLNEQALGKPRSHAAPSNLQLLRKRHIGNDIVTIVFQEPGSKPFCPTTIRSHFQHIFLVVRAEAPCTPHTSYRWAPRGSSSAKGASSWTPP